MELAATVMCIGIVLAVLAAGAWKTRPAPALLDDDTVARLREALLDPEHEAELLARIPPDARVLQMGGVGLGHLAYAVGGMAVGDVAWARRAHPDGKFRVADPAQPNLFLPETFTHVVIRDLDFVKHKAVWLQNAHKWLLPGGTLLLDTPRRTAKGGVRYSVREEEGYYTERIAYHGSTARHTRPIYRESDATVLDIATTAGFVLANGVYIKAS